MFAEVVAADQGTLFRGKILDISQTGCYIETRARLKLERLTDVEMLFRVNNCHFRTSARVMDIRPGKGLGVEFRPVDSQARELLQKLLQTLSDMAPPE
jgi:PilZ domain